MQLRKLLTALVVFGLLALWLGLSDAPPPEDDAPPASHRFFPELAGTGITAFRLGDEGKGLSLTRRSFLSAEAADLRNIGLGEPHGDEQGVWMTESVAPQFADYDAAETVAEALAELSWVSGFPAPTDLSPYGLGSAATAVTFATSSGEEYGLKLGNETPLGGKRYVYLAGRGAISLVDSWSVRSLERDPRRLLDSRVFPFDTAGITHVTLERPGLPPLGLTRGTRSWTIDGSDGRRAEQDWVRGLLRGLSSLQAASFEAPEQPQPTISVQVTNADGRAALLKIAPGVGTRTYSARSSGELLPAAFRDHHALIEATAVDPLLPGADEIWALQLLDFNPNTANLIEWQSQGSLWTFVRSGDDWSLRTGESAPPTSLPAGDVAAFLTSLAELRAESYSAGDLSASDAGSAAASLAIRQTDGHEVSLQLFSGGLNDRVAIANEPGLRDVSADVFALIGKHRIPRSTESTEAPPDTSPAPQNSVSPGVEPAPR